MPKEQRFGRSQVPQANFSTSPSTSSQLVGRDTPEVRSSAAGLEGLSQAFGSFFGQLQDSYQTIQKADDYVKQQEINRQNEVEKRQATGDALAGKPIDPSLQNDLDYVDTYRSVVYRKKGAEMAAEFDVAISGLKPETDIKSFTDLWLKNELAGSEDPEGNAYMLSAFWDQAQQSIHAFQKNQFKALLLKGKDELAGEVALKAQTGSYTMDDLEKWMEDSIELHPGDEVSARAFVMSTAISNSSRNKESAHRLIALLDAKGYQGDPEKSFFDKFPQVEREISNQLVQAMLQHEEVDLHQAQFEMDLALTLSKDDPMQILGLIDEYESIGVSNAEYEAWMKKAVGYLQAAADQEGCKRAYGDILAGGMADQATVSDAKCGQVPFLRSYRDQEDPEGIFPPRNAKQALKAARLVEQGKGIDPDLKNEMSLGLTNGNNPEQQEIAYTFWKSMSDTFRGQHLDGPASKLFSIVDTLAATGTMDLRSILTKLNEAGPEVIKNSSGFSWKETLRSSGTEGEAQLEVRSKIASSIASQLGLDDDEVLQNPGAMDTLLDSVKYNYLLISRAQVGDVDDAVKAAIKEASVRVTAVPGKNGVQRLELMEKFNGDIKPFGRQVKNQYGEMEDTIETWEEDLQGLKQGFPSFFDNSGTEQYWLENRKGQGYVVMEDGVPLILRPGQEVTIGPDLKDESLLQKIDAALAPEAVIAEGRTIKKSKVPSDFATAKNMLEEILPKGFTVIPVLDSTTNPHFVIGYKPRFKADDMDSVSTRMGMFNFPNVRSKTKFQRMLNEEAAGGNLNNVIKPNTSSP